MMAVVRIVKYLEHCLAQVWCVMINVLKLPFLWPSSDCAAVLLSGFLLVLQAWPPPSPAWYPLVCLLATSNPLGLEFIPWSWLLRNSYRSAQVGLPGMSAAWLRSSEWLSFPRYGLIWLTSLVVDRSGIGSGSPGERSHSMGGSSSQPS